MGKKAEVKAIVIQYPDGETKELTIEDAKALHRQLDELFGTVAPASPIIIERDYWPRWWPPYTPPITWKSGTTIEVPDYTPKVWCKAER